jgi:hypothetical protein
MFDLIGGKLRVDAKPTPVGSSTQFVTNYELDIRTYIDWRNRDIAFVPADHWMVSLILELGQKLGYDLDRTVEDIYRRVAFLTREISSTFGFTTSANAGRLHIGDQGNTTIYLVGESPRRLGVTRNTPYTDIIAIRYLSHDSTNLTMGSKAIAESRIGLGLDSIEIDLGLLMLQYTLWTREQLASGETDLRTPQIFVGMHVLPKLKASQYAIAMMNRITAIAEGLPVSDVYYRLSQSYVNRTQGGQSILESISKIILGRDVTFEFLLGMLPVPMSETLADVLTLPEGLPTRQNTWALVLSRYNALRYLWALTRMDASRAGRYPVNDIRRVIFRMINDGGLSVALGSAVRSNVQDKLEDLVVRTTA